MVLQKQSASDVRERYARRLREILESHLASGENALAWLEFDLDDVLQFAAGLVVITDQRILSLGPCPIIDEEMPKISSEPVSWTFATNLRLRVKEQPGSGILELLNESERLAYWRFTSAKASLAHRLVERFERLRTGEQEEDEDSDVNAPICPSCGIIIPPDHEKCPECEALKTKAPIQSFWRLARFAKPHRWMAILGISLTFASTAASLIPTYITIPMIDKVLNPYTKGENVDFSRIWFYLGGLLGASVLAWLLTWAKTFVMALVSERVSADMRSATYEHLHILSVQYFGGKRTGDLIARVSTDTDRISYFLSVNMLDFATDMLRLGMIATILIGLNPMLAAFTLLPLPIIAYLVQRVRTRLKRGFELSARTWGEMTSVLADTIPGIRVVKAFAQERREVDRFRKANDRVLSSNNRVNSLWAFFGATVTLLTDTGLLVVWAFGAWQIYQYYPLKEGQAHPPITIGVLQAFVTYIASFYLRMESMSRMLAAAQRAGASVQRVFSILDRAPSVPEPVKPVHPKNMRGEVTFREVGFHYGTRSILQEVNFNIAPGEMIGLVGPSGAGKSTLMNLVCRFYDVSEGALLVDGVDVRSYPTTEYRSHIGIVLQEPFLFFGTIAENIAYGRPDATNDEIVSAAKAARAHEFILRLPDGYDSIVGERGQFLSGGERQRISIARALLIDPRILILDEATSSVDTETEREIQLALENLVEGRTTIAIAHRLSTLRRANRLIVIERGRVTEVGPHDELIAKGGTYSRLHRAQQEMHENLSKKK